MQGWRVCLTRQRMFAKMSGKSLLLSSLAIVAALVPLFMASSEVYAQPCKVFQFDADYPLAVAPGQTFQVTSTISLTCYQWRTYYGGRVDIVDPASNTVLSISTFEIGTMANVTATVSNSATAPQTEGSWDLKLILYILESGGIVESVSRPIKIQVGAQSVSTTQQTTSTVSITSSEISTTSSQTTGSTVVASETSTMTTTSQTALGTGGVLAALMENSLVVMAALVLLVVALAVLAMRTRGRRPAPQEIGLSRVFCGRCGARNAVTNEFCISCGNKLEQRG
jgi:hypothetical protein